MSGLAPEDLLPLLRGRLGRPYTFVAECESTQRLLGPAEPEGATVATDHQTQGRGRLGRSWLAPAGRALLFSVVLQPVLPIARWPELSVLAGEAVAAALPVNATVAHPNDVMIDGRKIAGLLPEAGATAGAAGHSRVVLGIGVNVNQTAAELPVAVAKPATSLRLETGQQWPRAPLLAAILLELERRYDAWQRPQANR